MPDHVGKLRTDWFVIGRFATDGYMFRSFDMKLKFLPLAAAAALLFAASPGPQAEAAAAKVPALKAENSNIIEVRKRGHHFYRGYRSHRPRFHHRHYHRPRFVHRHRHWHRHRWHRGPRFAIYIGGGPRCSWLRRRAIITGSYYWWRRYRACRAGWWY